MDELAIDSISQSLQRMKESFLLAAATGGKVADIASLLDYGAEIDWRGGGDTPLVAACRKGHLEAVKLLLARGANPNLCGGDSMCPLHICAARGDYNMLNTLLESDANATMKTRDGLTALDIARNKGHEDIYGRLMQPRRAITPSSAGSINSSLGGRYASFDRLAEPSRLPGTELPPRQRIPPIASPPSSVPPPQQQSQPQLAEEATKKKNADSYVIMAPERLQEQEDAAALRRQLEKEKKLADKKIHSLTLQVHKLSTQLSELLEDFQQLQSDSEKQEANLQLLRGAPEALSSMSLSECSSLEKELKIALENVERRKDFLIKHELTNHNEQRLCVICQESEKSVVLLPCRHMCMCASCASHDKMKHCPLCRVTIESKISVFA